MEKRREDVEEPIIQGLGHRERRNILKTISLAPEGAIYSEILGELGLNTGRMNYHLKQLECIVEMTLFSYHGILMLLISAVEGFVVDIALLPLNKNDVKSICIASALSSASNVAVLQFVMMLPLPVAVFASMYLASFVSGFIFAGYLGKRVIDIISQNL